MTATIKDALLTKLPLAGKPPHDQGSLNWQLFVRVILMLAVVFLLSGWPHIPEGGFLVVLAAAGTVWAVYDQFRPKPGRRGLTGWRYVAVLATAFLCAAAWMMFASDGDLSPSQLYVPLLIGFTIAGAVDDGVIREQSTKVRGAMIRAIRVPKAGDAFDAHWPFQSSNDESVWAIDPVRRSIRLMLPALEPVDVVIAWDDPIRSVQLDRVERSWLGSNLPVIRGDRELTIVSGKDAASVWSYTFHFSGTDKEQARRWYDAVKAWMHADQHKGFA